MESFTVDGMALVLQLADLLQRKLHSTCLKGLKCGSHS